MDKKLNHIDEKGNAVMVDVSEKDATNRVATAGGRIKMEKETFQVITAGAAKKGDVLGVSRIAGIMAAKRTWELIPLCHPLQIEKCTVDFVMHENVSEVEAICTVKVSGKTGVEMEAFTGASIALLTIYDMCKAIDRSMMITNVCLYEKSGGKSGKYVLKENRGVF